MSKLYNVYEANKTMKMLGMQPYPLPKDYPLLMDLKAAYTDERKQDFVLYRVIFHNCFDLIMDVFSLGIIYGIRKERRRRKCR